MKAILTAKLFVYNDLTMKKMVGDLKGFHFYCISHFLYQYNTPEKLQEMDFSPYQNIVIDITNLIRDSLNSLLFAEYYLYELSEKIDNLFFCVHYDQLDSLIRKHPFLINRNSIDLTYHPEKEKNVDVSEQSISSPLTLFVVDSNDCQIFFQNNKLISFSALVDECEGIAFSYNMNRIQKKLSDCEIEYIDLSSATQTLNVRRDLVFLFEIMIQRVSCFGIKYCISESLLSDFQKLFPFLFTREEYLKSDNTSLKKTPLPIDINESLERVKIACERLRGHNDFKKDFTSSYKKYCYLQTIGERKILSIFLCGNSGIGKTEFAKILSDSLFPGEPLIKINFGNYSTEGVLNSLIGSPLGYIGSEEGGELINKIKLSKSKIVLIDEFEKATPSVFNFFYELLEDGSFTDRHGESHNLNGYIIIFTSNMLESNFDQVIPDSLQSRFDMVYHFVDLTADEKRIYIYEVAENLIEKLNNQYNTFVDLKSLTQSLNELVKGSNLRDIKREVENVVFHEFSQEYLQECNASE